MKVSRKQIFTLLLVFLMPAITGAAIADENVQLSGFVESDNRITIEGPSEFVYNETTLGLSLRAFPTDGVTMLGSFEIYTIGLDKGPGYDNDVTNLDIYEQQDRTQVDPVVFQLDQAYLQANGLGLKNLDVTIGKQRIAWGTGDQFNPTDNLNPDDMHDPLDFGKKIPTVAIQAAYYAGPVTISGAFLPLFTPALLPRTDVRPIFEKQFDELKTSFDIDTGNPTVDVIFNSLMMEAIKDADLGEVNVSSNLPDNSVENFNAGLKVAANVGPVDFSVSYAYTRDDFGVPRTITMTVDPFTSGTTKILDTVDVDVVNEYYRMHVIGADFSANIPVLDVGVWGEAAYFIPEPFETEYLLDMGHSATSLVGEMAGETLPAQVHIGQDEPLKEHYIKAVAGLDYTFPGAWYVNAQYIHGLPNDNTAELVDDYVFAGFDKPILHDSIKPRVFAGTCFGDGSWILFPEIFFYPMDSLELIVGALFVFGDVDTKFGAFGNDIAFFKAKVQF